MPKSVSEIIYGSKMISDSGARKKACRSSGMPFS